jgi:ectoine hydroxylase-related dioxygenase (phytanoyl-CoA dioxygenase family)
MLTRQQLGDWSTHGFVLLRRRCSAMRIDALLRAAEMLADRVDAGHSIGDAYTVKETALIAADRPLSRQLSKIFRVHRCDPTFRDASVHPDILEPVADLLGSNVDCLSQFIFKLPGALGQPWHQDAFYFPHDGPAAVGVWIAVTEATLSNGPLWVLPGSHAEPVHRARKDPREHTIAGYVEIVDHDFAAAEPVLMEPGDVLLFHSHLMHKSTDNVSKGRRAAMVYHFADAATIDRTTEKFGRPAPNVDWMPVLRAGRAVQAAN